MMGWRPIPKELGRWQGHALGKDNLNSAYCGATVTAEAPDNF